MINPVGKTITFIQHADGGHPGLWGDWCRSYFKMDVKVLRADRDELPFDLASDYLVILGGEEPAVSEPWFWREKGMVERFAETGNPVFGICYGSQLIAKMLGEEVLPLPREEYGWRHVEVVYPSMMRFNKQSDQTVFEWHEDYYDLPKGATLTVAGKGKTKVQGFELKNISCVAFHPEITAEMVWEWTNDPNVSPRLSYGAYANYLNHLGFSMNTLSNFLMGPP